MKGSDTTQKPLGRKSSRPNDPRFPLPTLDIPPFAMASAFQTSHAWPSISSRPWPLGCASSGSRARKPKPQPINSRPGWAAPVGSWHGLWASPPDAHSGARDVPRLIQFHLPARPRFSPVSFLAVALERGYPSRSISQDHRRLRSHPDPRQRNLEALQKAVRDGRARGATIGASVGPTVRLIYCTPMRGTDHRCMMPNDVKVWAVRCWRAWPCADQCTTLAPAKNSQSLRAWRHLNYRSSESRACATFGPGMRPAAYIQVYRALGVPWAAAQTCQRKACFGHEDSCSDSSSL